MPSKEPHQVPAIVRTAIDAANAHNTSAFLACFTDDGAVDDWGRVFTGHQQLRRWSDNEFIGKNVVLSSLRFTGDNNRVVLNARVGGDGYTGPSTFTFTLYEGKILLMRITA